MAGWPGAAPDRLPAGPPDTRAGYPDVPPVTGRRKPSPTRGCLSSTTNRARIPSPVEVLAAVRATDWQDRMVANLFSNPVIITYVDPDNVQLAQSTDNRLLPRGGENVRLGRTPYVVADALHHVRRPAQAHV